jgi:molybdopterin-guanine dinucleotide biosynthesis protein A
MKRITTVVLAGGQSKRMGKDKAFLEWNGKSFLRHILEQVDTFSNQIIISGNKEKNLYLKEAEHIKNEPVVVKDIAPYSGPLNGIASCCEFIKNETVFIATCDTPVIKENVVYFFLENIGVSQGVVPIINGKFQPLNTIYKKEAIKKAKVLYEKGVKSLFRWIKEINVKYIDESQLKNYDPKLLMFKSINTPSDYLEFLKDV